MFSTAWVTQLLSTATLLSDIFLGLVFLFWLQQKLFKSKVWLFKYVKQLIIDKALVLAFLVVLSATSGSLFYSELARFTPCKLCWFQRIFMYPQVILLGMALYKKLREVAFYVIPLSVMGAVIAAYQYYLQVRSAITPCSLDGADCSFKYTFHYGYITIPMMALTGFLLSAIFSYAHHKNLKVNDQSSKSL